jgi:hypothetical protein
LRRLALSAAFGIGATVVATMILFVPSLESVGDLLLVPGTFLPTLYWGGIHDPIQWLIAFVLNSCAFALISLIVLAVRDNARGHTA